LGALPLAKRLEGFRRDQTRIQFTQTSREMARDSVVLRKREQTGPVRGADELGDAAQVSLRRGALKQQRPLSLKRTRFEGRQDFSVTIQTVVYVNGDFISREES
jgi:hypothetical protein